MRVPGRVIIWSIVGVLAFLPILESAQRTKAEIATALVTVSVYLIPYGEEIASPIPIPDKCVLVTSDELPSLRFCDGDELDKDPRPGFIGFYLLAGVYYYYNLDGPPTNLPPDYDGSYSAMTPSVPLPETGEDVFFEFTSCHPHCPPFLSYFVALPTGDDPLEGQPDGVPVTNACFVLRSEDGSTLPEQCSSWGEVDFPEVEVNSYTIEPTSLPEGCTVDEIHAPQPFVVDGYVIHYTQHSESSWGNYYVGDIYLVCDSTSLANVSVAVVECPAMEMHDGLPCDGTPLAGAAFTFSEALWTPQLVTGADGTDSVAVLPGETWLTRLGSDGNVDALREDYVADVTCTETGSGQVLANERIYVPGNSSMAVPVRFSVVAGGNVSCIVDEYI